MIREFPWQIDQVRSAVNEVSKGRWFTGDYDINLWGVRTDDYVHANSFNDWIGCSFHVGGTLTNLITPATTDPGLYWRENPMNVNGTAIVVPGHYKALWAMGDHKGQYPALDQVGEIAVYRDANRDGKLDFDPDTIQRGLLGIELHQENPKDGRDSTQVDKWSAGCQVAQLSVVYAAIIEACRMQMKTYEGKWRNPNSFSYTLLTQGDLDG